MKQKYPLTLAAAKKGESSLWEIGDALLKECPMDSADGKLTEVAQYLQDNNCDYTVGSLATFRRVAAAFPKASRLAYSFSVHQEADNPKVLNAIVKVAPKGTLITLRYVRRIRQIQYEHELREREEAQEKARAEREKAEAEEERLRVKARDAKNRKERDAVVQEKKKAAERAEDAREKERAVKVPPRRNLDAPKEHEIPVLAVEAGFSADANQSIVLAKRSMKAIQGCLDQLTPKGIAALTEDALEAANAWNEAAQVVRREIIDQRGHLSVLGE